MAGGRDVNDLLDLCRPWIQAALDRGGNYYGFEDVCAAIEAGKMQLWAAEDGCCVTQISRFPRKRVLNVFLCGGALERALDMAPDIEAWGKAQGCDVIEMTGRRGWQKHLAADAVDTVLRKEIR